MKIKNILLFTLLISVVCFNAYGDLIHIATRRNNHKLIKKNLEDINKKNAAGRMPLHIAARLAGRAKKAGVGPNMDKREKAFKTVKLLVSKGAKVNAKTTLGKNTPLFFAYPFAPNASRLEKTNRLKVIKYLVEKNADVNTKNALGVDLLMRAIKNLDKKMVEFLLTKGAIVNNKHIKKVENKSTRLARHIDYHKARGRQFQEWNKQIKIAEEIYKMLKKYKGKQKEALEKVYILNY